MLKNVLKEEPLLTSVVWASNKTIVGEKKNTKYVQCKKNMRLLEKRKYKK